MSKKIKAWYFSDEAKKLRYGDGREIKLGETHEINGTPKLCKRGLHGSVKILDALAFAPGPIVWRVELSGDMDTGSDKIAAQKRAYVAGGVNIEHILRKFARKCALDVVNLWDAPDVVIEYLKTGKEELRAAAMDAAGDAIRATARAAKAAAKDAARAAKAAAKDAARDAMAARDAARAAMAARDAAMDARDAARAAKAAAKDAMAARAAARAAMDAMDAARDKQNKRLTAMVTRAIK